MSKVVFTVFAILIISIILFAAEFYLCKKKSKAALILPIVIACFFILIGVYALIVAAIMFGIYFIMKHIDAELQKKQSELAKMTIQDLE